MVSGLEVRVPYADHRLAQLVYNIPWEYRCRGGGAKGPAPGRRGRGCCPEEILHRRKSPYPKTHNPSYEALVKEQLLSVLRDSSQPIHKLLSEETVTGLLGQTFDYGRPWFGQLMAGPQLLAYLLQINFWLSHYQIYIQL